MRLHCLLVVAPVTFAGCMFGGPRVEAVVTAIAPDTVRLGDSVAIRVTVENISKRRLWLEGNHCFGLFRALNSAGEQVGSAYEGLMCALFSLQVGIAPGAKYERVGYWLGNSLGLPSKRVTVPPGQYTIKPTIGCCSPDMLKRWVPVRTVGSIITVVEQ